VAVAIPLRKTTAGQKYSIYSVFSITFLFMYKMAWITNIGIAMMKKEIKGLLDKRILLLDTYEHDIMRTTS